VTVLQQHLLPVTPLRLARVLAVGHSSVSSRNILFPDVMCFPQEQQAAAAVGDYLFDIGQRLGSSQLVRVFRRGGDLAARSTLAGKTSFKK
jgi:hypothetical protein